MKAFLTELDAQGTLCEHISLLDDQHIPQQKPPTTLNVQVMLRKWILNLLDLSGIVGGRVMIYLKGFGEFGGRRAPNKPCLTSEELSGVAIAVQECS